MGLAKIRSSCVRFGRQGWDRAHLQQSAVVVVLAVCGSICRGPRFQLLGVKGKGSVALSVVCIRQDRVALQLIVKSTSPEAWQLQLGQHFLRVPPWAGFPISSTVKNPPAM